MIKLDKTKSYYLCDLSEEQKDALCKEAGTDESNRSNLDNYEYMCFYNSYNMWLYGDEPYYEVINALELFYTLENVQVDCRELSEEQIKDMFDIYINNKYTILHNNYNFASELCFESKYFFIKQDSRDVFVGAEDEEKHTITHDKFMELFSKEEKPTFCEEVKQGYKEKDNKLSYELDFDFVEAMTKRIENEPKYPPYNWKKPMNINDLANALFRHAIEIKKGNLNDNGDLGHLIAVANNAMFMYYQLKNNEQSSK